MDLRQARKMMREAMDKDNTMCPLLVRITWHSCATYDKFQKNGGPNGGTLRFKKQQEDPENHGLDRAIALIEKIKAADTTGISYADLFVLAGYEAVEWSGGPKIPFRTGRVDYSHQESVKIYGAIGCPCGDGKYNPNNSRLPAADVGVPDNLKDEKDATKREQKTIQATRNFFARLNMNDEEAVALTLMGHQYGGAFPDQSGYDGLWFVLNPNKWNIREAKNDAGYVSVYRPNRIRFYREKVNAQGKRQYEIGPSFMKFFMLPADMVFHWDPDYKKLVQNYDDDRTKFFDVATRAWVKLTEQGCPELKDEMIYPVNPPGFFSQIGRAFSGMREQIHETFVGLAFFAVLPFYVFR